jgi:broad specificity phosphatase PhoE
MVDIIFVTHATSLDNEVRVASGHFDVGLAERGKKQARETGDLYIRAGIDHVFCSDLRRSYETALLAFGERFPLTKDSRLRECDYGDFTRHPSADIEDQRVRRVTEPFPNGESYQDAANRMKGFLEDLLRDYGGKRIMIIGHRATQYALEYWICKLPLEQVIVAPWEWLPGWHYQLKALT